LGFEVVQAREPVRGESRVAHRIVSRTSLRDRCRRGTSRIPWRAGFRNGCRIASRRHYLFRSSNSA
jgi:hypothetical protein